MFGELVVAYLFLGGTGGGACVVVGALGLMVDGSNMRQAILAQFRDECGRLYGRFFTSMLAAALGALGLGVVCLMADVGRPDRILLLMASAPITYLVVGAWALLVCALLGLWVLASWRGLLPTRLGLFRALHVLLMVAGFATALYTGLLLSSMPSVPLWNTPWLTAAFVLSSVSCGLALVLVATLTTGTLSAFASVARRLLRVDTFVIVAEAVVVALWLASVWFSAAGAGDVITPTDTVAIASVQAVCTGPWAPWLWLGLGVVGLALPITMEIVAIRVRYAPKPDRADAAAALRALPFGQVLAATLCVLFGGVCLRYVVVAAAMLPVSVYPL